MTGSKPKLLFITQNMPKRFASSGIMRLYFFVKFLCRDFDVVVATYFMPVFDTTRDVEALEDIGARVEAVNLDYPREGSDRFSSKLPGLVRSLLEGESFDIIHLERFWMAICLEGLWEDLRIPVVLDEMDVEYKREQRRFEVQGADKEARELWEKERRDELYVCARANRVIAVTEADRLTLLSELPGLDVTVIPTGQDVSWLNTPPERKMPPRNAGVLFCGHFRHNPNVDAVLYLAREIWPLVKAGRPDATLTLLGGSPPEEVAALAKIPGVEVPGWVDDLRPYYNRERVALVPLRFGSGIKAKIIEAVACGLPTVTTPIGAEGLTLEPGVDYYVEDDSKALAARTVDLLNDEEMYDSFSARARAAADAYDWERLYGRFREIYWGLLR